MHYLPFLDSQFHFSLASWPLCLSATHISFPISSHHRHFPIFLFSLSESLTSNLSVCACDICDMFCGIPPFPSQKASFDFFSFSSSLQSLPCFEAKPILRGWSNQLPTSCVQVNTTQSSWSLQHLASAMTGAEFVLPPPFLLVCSQ